MAAAAVETLERCGHEVYFHDLHEEKFDPIISAGEIPKAALLPPEIENYCREIAISDGIVIIHPNWWGQPPAILKGWIDRVLRAGVAYEFTENDKGEGVPTGLLKAKAAIVFNTSNTEASRENSVFGDPLEAIWRNCIFDLCGVKNFHRSVFSVVVVSSDDQRRQWLREVRETVASYFPAVADRA